MQEHYYNDKLFKIEELLIPTAINFLKQYYPNSEVEIIESYTKDNLTNKELQDKHVDIKLHLLDQQRTIYIDLKASIKEYNFLTFELIRKNIKNNIIKPGWTELVKEFPLEDQYVLFVSYSECILVKKLQFQQVRNKYLKVFSLNDIEWWRDKGCRHLYKKNKLFYLSRKFDIEMLKCIGVKYYLKEEGKWKMINLDKVLKFKQNKRVI